jgi:hypothetical protein
MQDYKGRCMHISSVTMCHINASEGGGAVCKIREQRKCRTIGFDMPKHVNCAWYQICCPLSDIVIGEVMPVWRSHTPVLSEGHFRDDLFIMCSPLNAAFFGGNINKTNDCLSLNWRNRYKLAVSYIVVVGHKHKIFTTNRRDHLLPLAK